MATYLAPTADFITTTLNGALAAAATSATIGTGLDLPATNGLLQIDYDSTVAVGTDEGPETIAYTSYTSGSGALAGLTRGVAGTTDVAHSDNSSVQCAPSAAYWGSTVLKDTDLPLGAVVQVVKTNSTAAATGATAIPYDDTIPQITEGVEFMTLAITPKSTSNILVIDVIANLTHATNANRFIGALFQDATANALAASDGIADTGTGGDQMIIRHTMAAGTTSATTFRFRAGGTSGTVNFNGSDGSRKFGAITKSSIVIWEYKA